MGLARALRLNRSSSTGPTPVLGSPWADTDLWTLALPPDLVAAEFFPMTRREALGVDAVSRARDLVCTTIARAPLRSYTGGNVDPDADQPPFLYRTDGEVHPRTRMLWTLDDLLFYGWSLWAVDRGADGAILHADRVPWDRWEFDGSGRVLVDDRLVDALDVLLFPGPHEGILERNVTTLRTAQRLERAAAARAANPVPLVELHQTVDVNVDPAERDALLAGYGQAVMAANGGTTGVAFTSYGIEGKAVGANGDGAAALVESRNYAAVTAARIIGLPAAMLDATSAGASLTYETTSGRRAQFVDEVRAYSDAVEGRLSLDDVVPRGRRVAFDVEQITTLTPSPSGPATLD